MMRAASFSNFALVLCIEFHLQYALSLAEPVPSERKNPVFSTPLLVLQDPHGRPAPAQWFQDMGNYLKERPNIGWDVYGDYTTETSFLRSLEAEIAHELGMDDAVFMPSGVMAQSIALLIHKKDYEKRSSADYDTQEPQSYSFVCHESSHLLLHEQDGYRELLNLQAIAVSTRHRAKGISIPCMTLSDVQETLQAHPQKSRTFALLLELPHRELGGKVNTWEELQALQRFCHEQGVAFYCDGARLFEATTGFLIDGDNAKSIQDLAGLFDSVYISCYKGLGGLSGAFLLGTTDFCTQARVWLRRFGGNLYTLLPYAVAAQRGHEREWKQTTVDSKTSNDNALSFPQKKQQLQQWVKKLTDEPAIAKWLSFDPAVPQTTMVHGYLRNCSLEQCQDALAKTKKFTNVEIVRHFKPVTHNPGALAQDFRVMFEWSIGQANGAIDSSVVTRAWSEFCRNLDLMVGG